MRLVLDTNVLVSGLLKPHGPPGRLVDLLTSGRLRTLYDDRILSEYWQVLLRPRFGFDRGEVSALLEQIENEGEAVLAEALDLLLPDPEDLPFLEVALSGRADALVTGNTRHFPELPNLKIERPAELLARLAPAEPRRSGS